MELLRILNNDLVGHLNNVHLRTDFLFIQWVAEDDAANLDITCHSILFFLYGVNVEGISKFGACFTTMGSSLQGSVESILTGMQGPYHAWRHVACKLNDQWRARLLPPDWNALLSSEGPEVDRYFSFLSFFRLRVICI